MWKPQSAKRNEIMLAIGSSVLGACLVIVGFAISSPAGAEATWAEQEGHHGVNTFQNFHNASGVGPAIGALSTINVSCKVYDPYIASVNPDGYWYRIASAPWNDSYYAPANTFFNGDPLNGPYTRNTDFNVPNCGTAGAPTPSISLSEGPAASSGYRYAISLISFPPNAVVAVSCHDSVDPSGFYTFNMVTDSTGASYTESQCFSGDGPDHWVVADGVESNHVSWSAGGGAGFPPVSTFDKIDARNAAQCLRHYVWRGLWRNLDRQIQACHPLAHAQHTPIDHFPVILKRKYCVREQTNSIQCMRSKTNPSAQSEVQRWPRNVRSATWLSKKTLNPSASCSVNANVASIF